MATDDRTEITLLDDFPETADFFGSHEKIADSIAAMINKEDGGRGIALEGSWGSGKSTIIELLKKKLPKQIFVFDAWSHEGDPLRRAFLDELLGYLCQRNPSNDLWDQEGEEFTAKRNELRKKIKRQETTTTPVFTRDGLRFSFLVLLMPIAVTLLGQFFRLGFGDVAGGAAEAAKQSIDIMRWFWKIMFFGILALALAPFFSLFRVVRRYKKEGKDFSNVISVFLNKTAQKQEIDTFEDIDPTSLEFVELFSGWLEDGLSADEDKLLIVIDNLDRLPREQALTIWSTLAVYIEACSKGANWAKRVWFIVPYDRGSIDKLWANNHHNQGHDNLQNDSVAASFLDKTFQVRFEVPPLILSNWIDHLKELLDSAFSGLAEDEVITTSRLCHTEWQREKLIPTPRDIKRFVNDIGAIRRQWPEYLLQNVAYYVLLRNQSRNIRDGILSGDIPEKNAQTLLGKDCTDTLLSLHFNVSPESAKEILFRGQIESALTDYASDELLQLSNSSGDGFGQIFKDVLQGAEAEWCRDTTQALKGCYTLLEFAGYLDLDESGRVYSYKDIQAYARWVLDQKGWSHISHDIGDDMAAMLKLVDDESRTQNFLEELPQSYVEDQDAGAWVEGMIHILKAIDEVGHNEALNSIGCLIPKSSAGFTAYADTFVKNKDTSKQFWPHLYTEEDVSGELQQIEALIAERRLSDDHVARVELIASVKSEIDWTSINTKANEYFKQGENLNSQFFISLVEILWEIARKTNDYQTLRANTTEGGFHHFYYLAQREKNNEVSTLCLLFMLRYSGTTAPTANIGNIPEGVQNLINNLKAPDATEVIELCKKMDIGSYTLIMGNLLKDSGQTLPFIEIFIEILIKQDKLSRYVDYDSIKTFWDSLNTGYNTEKLHEVFKYLLDNDFISKVLETDFMTDSVSFYCALGEAGGYHSDEFVRWCREGLEKLKRDEWIDTLNAEDEKLSLALELKKYDDSFALGVNLQDALLDHSKRLVSDSDDHEAYEGWDEVVQLLDDQHLQSFKRYLIQDILNISDGAVGSGFFDYYRNTLIDERELRSRENLIRVVFSEAVRTRHLSALEWIVDTLNDLPNLLSEFEPDEVIGLKERVREALSEDEVSEALENLAEILGVEIDDEDADEESADEKTGA